MNVFDNNSSDSMNGILMQREDPFIKRDILYFAVQTECKNFIALPSIQNVITDLWYRRLIHKAGTRFKLKVKKFIKTTYRLDRYFKEIFCFKFSLHFRF
jgi:hypothetical protein